MNSDNPPGCEQARDRLDNLLEAMVQSRIADRYKRQFTHVNDNESLTAIGNEKKESECGENLATFEPTGALKEHIDSCSDCHNYQLANRVIIEAAKFLPRVEASDALTDSIMAMVKIAQEERYEELPDGIQKNAPETLPALSPLSATKTTASLSASHWQNKQSFLLLLASFSLFTVMSGGFFSSGINQEELWSTGSWLLALLAVALLKPIIENPLVLTGQQTIAKA